VIEVLRIDEDLERTALLVLVPSFSTMSLMVTYIA
jgi:hypothetical protein